MCDCELRWYKQWIEDEWNPVEEQWLQDTYCTSPKDGRKHKIHEVELKDMFCDSSVKDKAGRVSFYTKKYGTTRRTREKIQIKTYITS